MNKDLIHCVIILNYNDWQSCKKLIDSIVIYNNISYIIVVDNSSTDVSVEKLISYYGSCNKIIIIRSKSNKGYANGNDIGCKYAIKELQADFITIANPDVYFSEKTLSRMLEISEKTKNVGAVGCMMKCHSDINLPSAWKLPDYRDCILENLYILRKIIGNRIIYRDDKSNEKVKKVDVIAGSLFTISAKVYTTIGGFDCNTFLYYEENILAQKIKKCSFQNYLCTDVYYDHLHSVSINKSFKTIRSRLDLAYKSREYYVTEYLNVGYIKRCILKITYIIGKNNYIFAKHLQNLLKKNKFNIRI